MSDQKSSSNQPQTPPKKDKAIMDQVALLSFIDEMIQARKDPAIKPENLPNVKTVLLRELNETINTHLITLLSEKDQRELDGLLDKNVSDDELNDFFSKKIPNLEAEMVSALLNFRAAYLFPVTSEDTTAPVVRRATDQSKVQDITSDLPTPVPIAPLPLNSHKKSSDKGETTGFDLPPPAPVAFKKPN